MGEVYVDMAILFYDGFERNTIDKWVYTAYSTYDSYSVSTPATGMTGSYAVRVGDRSSIHKVLDSSKTELYGTLKVNMNSASNPHICQFKDSAGTIILTIRRNVTTYLIEAILGTYSGSVLGTGSHLMSGTVTYLVEFYYKPANTGGIIQVKVNGVTEIDYTGDTTFGLENVQTFLLGYDGAANYSSIYDDVALSDSEWLGNKYVTYHVPTADGSTMDWTPSTGTAYGCIDEAVASNTDYIYSDTIDQVALFAITDAVSTVSSIDAIDIYAKCAYEGTPTPTKQKIVYKSGSTVAYGSDIIPALSFDLINTGIIETDPDTGVAFTTSGFNSLEIGIKAIA